MNPDPDFRRSFGFFFGRRVSQTGLAFFSWSIRQKKSRLSPVLYYGHRFVDFPWHRDVRDDGGDIGTPAPVPRVHPHPVIERLQTRALKLLYFRMETSRAVIRKPTEGQAGWGLKVCHAYAPEISPIPTFATSVKPPGCLWRATIKYTDSTNPTQGTQKAFCCNQSHVLCVLAGFVVLCVPCTLLCEMCEWGTYIHNGV